MLDKTIYIILPVHNRADITEKFCHLLIKQSYQNFKLILIDDGCTDDTCGRVESIIPKEKLVILSFMGGNLWWAGGLQKGYEWVTQKTLPEDYVLIINDDVYIEKGFIEKGVTLLKNSKATLWGSVPCSMETKSPLSRPFIVIWDDFDIRPRRPRLYTNPKKDKQRIDALSTRGLFLKTQDFKNIGGFYPKIMPHYLSDLEFTYRAKQLGHHLCISDSLKVYVNEKTTGIQDIRERNFYYRIRFLFSNRCASNPLPFLVFVLLRAPNRYYRIKGSLVVLRRIFEILIVPKGIRPVFISFLKKAMPDPLYVKARKFYYQFRIRKYHW